MELESELPDLIQVCLVLWSVGFSACKITFFTNHVETQQ